MAAICRVLIHHGVQFVIIGGMAARLHDTGHATVEVDICPSTDDVNFARLAAALADLGARLRVLGDPDGIPFEPHADMLRQVELMTLITQHGPLDLCFVPDGFPAGYASLSENAAVVEIAQSPRKVRATTVDDPRTPVPTSRIVNGFGAFRGFGQVCEVLRSCRHTRVTVLRALHVPDCLASLLRRRIGFRARTSSSDFPVIYKRRRRN